MPRSRQQYQPSALGTKKKAESPSSTNNISNKRHKNSRQGENWADALLKFLEDPSDPAVVYVDDDVIAIQDKYPKAKHHYLVMPRDTRYRSIRDLDVADLPLLKRMENVANKLVHDINDENDEPLLQYKYGFHAVPSMNHLHMHVISQDFDSTCLRHKKHWNSFTTTFFVPLEELLIAVEKGDTDFGYRKNRLQDGLKCHLCGRAQTTMPALKEHIRSCGNGGKADCY